MALIVGAGVVIAWAADRHYQTLLDKLPASIASGCRKGEPDTGSSAQAYCRSGTFSLWTSVFDMTDNVRPSTSVAGNCATPPRVHTFSSLPPGTRTGVISCVPSSSYYNIRWGVDELLVTGLFQSEGLADYAATYQHALDVLRQLPS